jgi:hypothetical protein
VLSLFQPPRFVFVWNELTPFPLWEKGGKP